MMITGAFTWLTPAVGTLAALGLWRAASQGIRHGWRIVALSCALVSVLLLAGQTLWADRISADSALVCGFGVLVVLLSILYDDYRTTLLLSRDRESSHRVHIALATSDKLDGMLMAVASALRSNVHADSASVYKISSLSHRAQYLGETTFGRAKDKATAEVRDFLAELAWWASHEDRIVVTRGMRDDELICVPLSNGRQVYAIVLVHGPREQLSADRLAFWTGLAAVSGRTIANWAGHAADASVARLSRTLPALSHRLAMAARLEDMLSYTAEALEEIVAFDYIALSSLGSSREHEDRAAFLTASRRIIDSRRGWPIAESPTRRVAGRGTTLVTPDLAMAEGEHNEEPWESRLGMRSRIVMPIRVGGQLIGTLTLAHRQVACYGADEADLLEMVCVTLGSSMQAAGLVRNKERTEARQTMMAGLSDNAAIWPGEKVLLRQALPHLNVAGLRLYRLTEGGQSLREVASAGRAVPRETGSVASLAALPWHRWAIESRRTLQVDQSDPEAMMGQDESQMALSAAMKTGCLVPIVREGKTLGILDVIEERHPDRNRLDATDRLLLTVMAGTIAEQWTGVTPNGQSGDTLMASVLRTWARDVVNPLTSIIGSVELIRYRNGALGGEIQKYLTTIERSAGRIHESLTRMIGDTSGDVGHLPDSRRCEVVTQSKGGTTPRLDFARPASVAAADVIELTTK